MERREFFKNTSLVTAGVGLTGGYNLTSAVRPTQDFNAKTAKNINFMDNDSMSQSMLTKTHTHKEQLQIKL